MRDNRPEPGSAWERHCPTKWPREWLENGQMPPGFTPATNHEADLITGRITETIFRERTGKNAPSPVSLARKPTKRKPHPVMQKLNGYNQFYDGLAEREPRLHPLAVALWGWLWRCEREGFARASERKLADRFGVVRNTIRKSINELIAAGVLTVARKGIHGCSATVYRIRPHPKRMTSNPEST